MVAKEHRFFTPLLKGHARCSTGKQNCPFLFEIEQFCIFPEVTKFGVSNISIGPVCRMVDGHLTKRSHFPKHLSDLEVSLKFKTYKSLTYLIHYKIYEHKVFFVYIYTPRKKLLKMSFILNFCLHTVSKKLKQVSEDLNFVHRGDGEGTL